MKPYASGLIHLLGNPAGNFWNDLENNSSNAKAYIDGFRGRTRAETIWAGGVFAAPDFTGIDSAIVVCREFNKQLTLSCSMGIDMPSDFYTTDPFVNSITVDLMPGTGIIPACWQQGYIFKIAPWIAALGKQYDSDETIRAVFTAGYQQVIEAHVTGTTEEYDAYTALAQADGFATAEEAWLYATKLIIDLWIEAFPTTAVMLTGGNNPFFGSLNGDDALNEIEDYIVDTYPGHGGRSSSFLHAKLTHTGIPTLRDYPNGDQAISLSTDDTRFYAPAIPGMQPGNPTDTLNLLENGFDQGDQYVEVYEGDIEDPLNQSMFVTERLRLISNLPAGGLGGNKATITAKT